MKTLVLGHGRIYTKDNTKDHSPCNWYNDEYTCVHESESVNPDIVFDLRKEWSFCGKNEYDRIIDTTGLPLKCWNVITFKKNILNALNENGVFYGRDVCWKKQGENLVYI